MQPFSRNQCPDLLTSLMNMSLVLRLPREMHLCRSSSNVPRLPSFLEMLQNSNLLLTFDKVPNPLHLPRETNLNVRKCSVVPLSFLHFWLGNVLRATTACTFSISQLPKVVRAWCVLYMLTAKCASRHNSVHFFDISTSKSGPNMRCFVHFDCHNGAHFFDISTSKSVPELRCFVHFDLEMCFSPQWCATFHVSSDHMAPHPPL